MQTRIDIFVDGKGEEHYVVDQALEDYDHIMDNLHAQSDLLEQTVHAGLIQPVASGIFLLESWDFGALMGKLPPRETQGTAPILEEIRRRFLDDLDEGPTVRDGVEILATEYLDGVWYQKC